MESLKIAMFSWESLYSIMVGGLASAVSELSEALVKNGHEVHVFTRTGKQQTDYEVIDGVNYHRCFPEKFDSSGDILNYFEKMGAAMMGRFYSAENNFGKFDIVHVHDWHVLRAPNHSQLISSHPYFISFHSTEWGRSGGKFSNKKLFKEISKIELYGARAAKRIITVSETMKEELIQLYNPPREKIDIIPNGIVQEKFKKSVNSDRVKKRYEIQPTDPVIFFIGRLTRQKGPDILIDAIPDVLKHREDAKFIIAGKGLMRKTLQRLSKSYGLSDSLRLLGYLPQNEYLSILNSCDIVCIPSRNEPFGLVLLEAWSAKKAVVASDVGGLSENIEHSKNGIKVPPDPKSIARGINSIINDPSRLKELGEEGYKVLEKRFNWNVVAKYTVETYKKV